MPLHDWTRVDAGTFHHLHTTWIVHLAEWFNRGVLPEGYYALAEQHAGRIVGDILTLHNPAVRGEPGIAPRGSVALAEAPPRVARRVVLSREATYRTLRKTLTIRHVSGHRVVALIEIISPANKDRAKSVEEFVGKVLEALKSGVHVLMVDLFPPGKHDPDGMHRAIWESDPADEEGRSTRSYTFASYLADRMPEAFLNDLDIGEPLPEMPLFLDGDGYINVPLEETYQAAYRGVPQIWRAVIEGDRTADLANLD